VNNYGDNSNFKILPKFVRDKETVNSDQWTCTAPGMEKSAFNLIL